MSNIKYIVTHSGPAHRDDLLACAVLVANRSEVYIYRREPTEAELDDPDVAVVDVGGRHEPHLNNYDHHQLPRDAPPTCALTLVLDAMGILDDAREALPWLSATEEIDSKGPFAWAKANGVSWETVAPLAGSPVEGWLLQIFQGDSLDPTLQAALGFLLKSIGRSMLDRIEEFAKRQALLNSPGGCDQIRHGDLVIVDARCVDRSDRPVFGLEAWCKRNAPKAAITITQDDRGAGFCLFRRNDDPRVDFSRCNGMPGVVFAHANGFVLKTAPDAGLSALIAAACK